MRMRPSTVRVCPSWRHVVESEARKPYFAELKRRLLAESQAHAVFPPPNRWLAALDACPLPRVRVVIIGQDPYHGDGRADALRLWRLGDDVQIHLVSRAEQTAWRERR